jgi:phage FluMu protein Com
MVTVAKAPAIRCPKCQHKLAEEMQGGILRIWCRHCKEIKVFDKRLSQ